MSCANDKDCSGPLVCADVIFLINGTGVKGKQCLCPYGWQISRSRTGCEVTDINIIQSCFSSAISLLLVAVAVSNVKIFFLVRRTTRKGHVWFRAIPVLALLTSFAAFSASILVILVNLTPELNTTFFMGNKVHVVSQAYDILLVIVTTLGMLLLLHFPLVWLEIAQEHFAADLSNLYERTSSFQLAILVADMLLCLVGAVFSFDNPGLFIAYVAPPLPFAVGVLFYLPRVLRSMLQDLPEENQEVFQDQLEDIFRTRKRVFILAFFGVLGVVDVFTISLIGDITLFAVLFLMIVVGSNYISKTTKKMSQGGEHVRPGRLMSLKGKEILT